MGIGRVLVVIAIVWFGFTVYRRLKHGVRGASGVTAKLLRCSTCGVFIPEADARVQANGTYQCAHHHGSGREQ